MSTFGSAVIVDLDTRDGIGTVLDRLRSADGFDPDRAVIAEPVQIDGRWRLSVYVASFAVEDAGRDTLLQDVGTGRAVVGDDYDDRAVFTAWRISDGRPTIVYRALIDGPEEAEWSAPAIVGAVAAAELAGLYQVASQPLVDIDGKLEDLADELGIVGGPFPWFDALNLAWPAG